jgi:hypothetical protein
MSFKRLAGLVVTVLMAVLLTSCNMGATPVPTIDANAIYTAAAQTLAAGVSAGMTQTAEAVTPTSAASPTALSTLPGATGSVPFATLPGGTPLGLPTVPVNTAASGAGSNQGASGCNNALYIGETGPADKSTVDAGKPFTKGWSMQNNGTCSWGEGYSFAFLSGEQLQGRDVVIGSNDTATAPGHSQAFVVKLTAPKDAGEYIGNWQMKAPDGTRFGTIVYFDVVVK